MDKITIDKTLFCLPWTQTILGTQLDGKANFMALDWLTRVNIAPPMLGICVNKEHASHRAILNTKEYCGRRRKRTGNGGTESVADGTGLKIAV
jgi:flavin reductase (DIM6/NTAB) family NADH-FMN oxidoreductase RutF